MSLAVVATAPAAMIEMTGILFDLDTSAVRWCM